MKKTRIILLLLALIFIFTSCVTKQDVKDKENMFEDIEEEFEELEEDFEELEADVAAIETTLEDLNSQISQAKSDNEQLAAENAEIEANIIQPAFIFCYSQFYDHFEIVTDESNHGIILFDVFSQGYDEKSVSGDGISTYTYVLDGDIDSSYVALTITTLEESYKIYEIGAKYYGEENRSDYDTLVEIITTAILIMNDDPYSYDDDYFDYAQECLEEGVCLEDYIVIEQENTDLNGSTRFYCIN